MAENKQSGIFGNMTPQQTFIFGLVGGVMVLCTIGFFILLAVVFDGGISTAGKSRTTAIAGDTEGPEDFSQCLDSGKYTSVVQQDFALGAQLGVNGTPATFIDGYLVSGALPYEALKQVVDARLAGQEPNFDFMQDQEGNVARVDLPEFSDAIWLGNENAAITVVEFSDFECPYCNRFLPSVKQLVAEYGDQIKFTYRHFPLSFHPNAQKAAEAFECAKEQDAELAWAMHDELFALGASQSMSVQNYKKVASELGLE